MPQFFKEDDGWDLRQSSSLRSTYKVATCYVKVHKALGTEFKDIDDHMVGLVRFAMSPDTVKKRRLSC